MKTIILILLCLLLIACNKEEPIPVDLGYKFHCVPEDNADSLNVMYYFQVSVGDSTDGLSLIDHDTTFIIGQSGEVQRDIETLINLDGKYCQMYCFYQTCGYNFVPCCFFAKKGNTKFYESCTPGVSRAFLITE